MNSISTLITEYLDSCRTQKCLDEKTLKAYRIDLRQFSDFISDSTQIEVISDITSEILESYISRLHAEYKPKTAKRKIASIKALFHYCEYKDLIDRNPFSKIHTRFREPVILPKTIPLHIVESFLSTIYTRRSEAGTAYQRRNALRDAAVIELLFSSGIRISELCNLKNDNVNIHILDEYRRSFSTEISSSAHFFVNQSGAPLSDQSVRRMINKYCSLAAIDLHITPHMFRHTFATSLLEADVDIRYIQEMLGHSSINVTQIYTHVAVGKQRDILRNKHPRKGFRVGKENDG